MQNYTYSREKKWSKVKKKNFKKSEITTQKKEKEISCKIMKSNYISYSHKKKCTSPFYFLLFFFFLSLSFFGVEKNISFIWIPLFLFSFFRISLFFFFFYFFFLFFLVSVGVGFPVLVLCRVLYFCSV